MQPAFRSESTDRSTNPRSYLAVAARLLLFSSLAVLAICLLTIHLRPVRASGGSLSMGSVSIPVTGTTCPSAQFLSGMNCYKTTLQGCPNVDNLDFVYGTLIPTGTTVNGIVVFFDGGDGTNAAYEGSERQMLQYYYSPPQNYGVVEIAWSSPWEYTSTPNIQNAACRPATFLNYVWSTIYKPIAQANSSAGMCAQGFSAGSAAIGYSMAYYNAASYLDNVELISGPVLSDIRKGCSVPNAGLVTVCPSGQLGCPQGQNVSWQLSPTYLDGDAGYLNTWTGINACAGNQDTTQWNDAWLSESIVDTGGTTGATPTFVYGSTAIGAWLCRSLAQLDVQCSGDNYNYDHCPNNSSPQGQLFYQNFTSTSQFASLNIYPVDGCGGPEGVPAGNVSYLQNDPSGQAAIENDMVGNSSLNIPAHCAHPAP